MSGPYDDIMDLPHHVSPTRPRMSMLDRAAQFSPFAALTGYDAAIQETGRLTQERVEPGAEWLDQQLQALARNPQSRATITYFCPDSRKSGGAYRTITDVVTKLDPLNRQLTLQTGATIPLDEILDVQLENP